MATVKEERPKSLGWLLFGLLAFDALWTLIWFSLGIIFNASCNESNGGCEGMPLVIFFILWFWGMLVAGPATVVVGIYQSNYYRKRDVAGQTS